MSLFWYLDAANVSSRGTVAFAGSYLRLSYTFKYETLDLF